MNISGTHRIHEIGKYFGVQSKEIMELVAKYYTEPKNHMHILEDKELDLIFEHFTQKYAVESLLTYFSFYAESDKKQAEEKAVAKKQAEEEAVKLAKEGKPPALLV